MDDTYDFEFSTDGKLPLVKSIVNATRLAVEKTHMMLRTLHINPSDATRLSEEVKSAPLTWLTVVENPDIKVGSARLSL
mgnify:CR=1 FL=1